MYTILLNAVLGLAAAAALYLSHASGPGWTVFWGFLVFLLGQLGTGYLLQRKVKADMFGVQKVMADGQARMKAKVQQWQIKPPGSYREAQEIMEREQRKIVDEALEASKILDKYLRWVPLMKKQLATLRMQLYWSIKEFKQVDALLPDVIYIEPLTGAIKMARMYMKNEDHAAIDAFFRKQVKRLRYGQGAILYALMSWIYVQDKKLDEANKVLIAASEKMENPVIKSNRENLANNRVAHFSNAALGDQWYALHLELPKVKAQRPSPFAPQRRF